MRGQGPVAGPALVAGSLVVLVVLVVLVAPVLVDGGGPARPGGQPRGSEAGTPAPVVQVAARRLLERAAAAPATASYSGTQFVSAWSSDGTTSQVLEVSHSPQEPLDSSILGGGAVELITRYYSLSTAAPARVAGRVADVVEAFRPGSGPGDVPVARFWLDRDTGLVLRREVYDRAGRRVRASAFIDLAFVDLALREAARVDAVRAPAAGARAWPTVLDAAAVERMRTSGWNCPSELPGPLPLVDARRGGDSREIVHLSYADGIASISVFQQRGSLDRDRLRGYRHETVDGREQWVSAEVPRRVVWATGGTVYTVVADAPERTVDRTVEMLHAAAGEGAGGPADRLGRGLDRLGSWFNPFE